MVGIDVKSSSFEVFTEYMARSSWSMVLYDFWALLSFREKKASGDASTVMQVVLVAQGWLSRIAQLARVSLHQRLTDVG